MDLKAKLAAIKAAKLATESPASAPTPITESTSIVEKSRADKLIEEFNITTPRFQDSMRKALGEEIKPAIPKVVVDKTADGFVDLMKEISIGIDKMFDSAVNGLSVAPIKAVSPRLVELRTKKECNALSLKERLELNRLEKEALVEDFNKGADKLTGLDDAKVQQDSNEDKVSSSDEEKPQVQHKEEPDSKAENKVLLQPDNSKTEDDIKSEDAKLSEAPVVSSSTLVERFKELEAKEASKTLTLKEKIELLKMRKEALGAPIDLPAATIVTIPAPDPIVKIADAVQADVKKMSLAEKLAMKRAAQEEAALAVEPEETMTSIIEEDVDPNSASVAYEPTVEQEINLLDAEPEKLETFSLNITLNKEQLAAKDLAFAGKSFCLIGAAGTGKTSTQRDVAKTLVMDGKLRTVDYKIAGGGGARINAPSIAFCAYTRRASANLSRAIHKDPDLKAVLQHNIMTIHHLLEYEPVEVWVPDEENGGTRQSMRFEPQRHAGNPLQITHLVIEEASMVGLDLWEKLYDALPTGVQIIFIGDINQLPPVFGSSILNYALVQLPVVELKTVYRQQGDSLVLANAHNILKGKTLEEGKGFTIMRGKSNVQVGQGKMASAMALGFKQMYLSGDYDPADCIILSPFNKQDLGTDSMNKHVAQFLGQDRGAVVHEILAGMSKHYLAVGDKVMYNKQDGIITEINRNGMYHGKEPQAAGTDLTRFGVRILGAGSPMDDLDSIDLGYENFSLEELEEQQAERKQQASHVVHVELETGQVLTLENAGDFAQQIFTLAYVLTVHKAQGCEWRKVFGLLHKDHSVMLFRELLYTLVTRAREEVVLVAKDTILEKAIRTQRIKGDSLAEKIEYFNSGAVEAGRVECTK